MSKQQTVTHYDNYAKQYENQWRGYLNNTHSKLCDRLLPDLEERDTILDVSCGTGLLASKLIQKSAPFRELVLNDLSPQMLEIAQSRLPKNRGISFTASPVESLPFDNNRFTKVICLNAFHNYEDQSIAVKQFKRVLAPHGKLYLLDWNRTGWFRLLNMFLRWTRRENINTHTLNEVNRLFRQDEFSITYTDQWSYNYWKFFLIVGG